MKGCSVDGGVWKWWENDTFSVKELVLLPIDPVTPHAAGCVQPLASGLSLRCVSLFAL